MGVRDNDDQDKIIEKIKVLINKEKADPTDVWDKEAHSNDVEDKNKSKSSDWE